jgi:hypothetical protein
MVHLLLLLLLLLLRSACHVAQLTKEHNWIAGVLWPYVPLLFLSHVSQLGRSAFWSTCCCCCCCCPGVLGQACCCCCWCGGPVFSQPH